MTTKAIYTYLFGVGESHLGKLVVGNLVDAVLIFSHVPVASFDDAVKVCRPVETACTFSMQSIIKDAIRIYFILIVALLTETITRISSFYCLK